jgi:hypothetical protein
MLEKIAMIEPYDDDPLALDTEHPEFDDVVEGEVLGIPTVSLYGSEIDGIPEPH